MEHTPQPGGRGLWYVLHLEVCSELRYSVTHSSWLRCDNRALGTGLWIPVHRYQNAFTWQEFSFRLALVN